MWSLQLLASARSARTFSSACRILMTPASGGQRGGARRCARASVLVRMTQCPNPVLAPRMAKGPRLRRLREGPPSSGGTVLALEAPPSADRGTILPRGQKAEGLSLSQESHRPGSALTAARRLRRARAAARRPRPKRPFVSLVAAILLRGRCVSSRRLKQTSHRTSHRPDLVLLAARLLLSSSQANAVTGQLPLRPEEPRSSTFGQSPDSSALPHELQLANPVEACAHRFWHVGMGQQAALRLRRITRQRGALEELLPFGGSRQGGGRWWVLQH